MIHKESAYTQHSLRLVEEASQCHRIMPCRCRTPGARGSRSQLEISRSQAGCNTLSLAANLPNCIRSYRPAVYMAPVWRWDMRGFPHHNLLFGTFVDTSTSGARNCHAGNSFWVSHMRAAPVLGYGRLEDPLGVTVFTHSFSKMESTMDKKRNTDGLQRPWCTSGSARQQSLRSRLDRPPRYTLATERYWE